MPRLLIVGGVLIFCLTARAQEVPIPAPYTQYAELITAFRQQPWLGNFTTKLPVLFAPRQYSDRLDTYREPVLKLSAIPSRLSKQQVLLQRPPGSTGYPVGPSVILGEHLIALFSSGRFGCYRLTDFSRNPRLEEQLNIRSWQYQWLLEGKLVAKAGSQLWQFQPDGQWQPYTSTLPMGMRPVLYADNQYLVYGSCMGEFGGQVSFYDQTTRVTSVVEATCPNAVWRTATGQFAISTSLAHMAGSSGLQYLTNPKTLPSFRLNGKQTEHIAAEAPALDTTGQVPGFQYAGILLQKAGTWQGQSQFLYHSLGGTVLAVPQQDTLLIVDPLFNTNLRRNYVAVTHSYGPVELVSFTDPFTARAPEIAALLIGDNKLTLLEWKVKKPKTINRGH
ncbi:hypothetical protein K3G63_14525 [Hymenobacter sp. HSC-4F20]|uniref:hypothetical protein n=1 Tax=Hymenobacter sp. HSC-4F20 TaxID=2864135 RepID=UPI001C72B0F9|nr:hypothetical protein [Hymenobacter sp. HSC-4F20]MBX0291663.1 hypothetical protein [Hymenobacter sp. HSC-4F20]